MKNSFWSKWQNESSSSGGSGQTDAFNAAQIRRCTCGFDLRAQKRKQRRWWREWTGTLVPGAAPSDGSIGGELHISSAGFRQRQAGFCQSLLTKVLHCSTFPPMTHGRITPHPPRGSALPHQRAEHPATCAEVQNQVQPKFGLGFDSVKALQCSTLKTEETGQYSG